GAPGAAVFGDASSRARLDDSVHPFEPSCHPEDARIPPRYQRNYRPSAMFAIFHEAGYALYEQGIPPALARTCIGHGGSMGLHESQSRMWENLVGRSRPFWQHYYPILQRSFAPLRQVDVDTCYRAVNRVQPSLIRVEADEVTYNLHIMLPYELAKHFL